MARDREQEGDEVQFKAIDGGQLRGKATIPVRRSGTQAWGMTEGLRWGKWG